jgi:hypothetical protein
VIRFFLYSLKENSRSVFFLLVIKTIEILSRFLFSAKYILLRDLLGRPRSQRTSGYSSTGN